jgi:transcriptional regulator with XRE-family HTH domain
MNTMSRPDKKPPSVSRGAVPTSGIVSGGKSSAAGLPIVRASLSPEQVQRAKRLAPQLAVRRPRRTRPRGAPGEQDQAAEASAPLLAIVHALKQERERQKLTLADVSDRCGIEKGALSNLENGQNPNPTFETLQRYARSLGQELTLNAAPGEGAPAAGTRSPAEAVVGPEAAHLLLQRLAHSSPEDRGRFEELVLSMLMMAWASGMIDPTRDLKIPDQEISALYASTFQRLIERGVPFVGKEQLHQLIDHASAES